VIGIVKQDLSIISNLYWNQTSAIRVEANDIPIKRGVRQGCILSPLLFNFYSKFILREALDEVNEGIKVNGKCINNIRYANDTVVIANNMSSLRKIVDRIVDTSESFGLPNISKAKYIVIMKKQNLSEKILIRGQQIEEDQKYKYLGTWVNEDWEHGMEVKCRIEMARGGFVKMSKILKCHGFLLGTKIRILRC